MTDYLHDRLTVAVGTHYLIEGEIGRGGMSVVYRAVDLRLHRPVAIKLLPPELAYNPDVRARFIREAQTAAQLAHPHIVPIYSVDEKDGLVYFVMALVQGESVAARLAREGPWPADRVARVLRDVADALAYAHERGVIHRDIKPDNILIEGASGRALVTDFGIARAIAGETRITATGVTVGTPAYMSPEQAIGERELDGRSDLYSLGVVGYQMLAGETPFSAANTPAMLVKHVSERPRPVRERRPDVPAYLAVAIDRCLAKRPENRWSSAAEFRDAIARAQEPEPSRGGSDQRAPWSGAPPIAPIVPPIVIPPPAPLGLHDDGFASFPPPPSGLSRKELRHWNKMQRHLVRKRYAQLTRHDYDDRPLEQRVIAFRRSAARFLVLTPILFVGVAGTHGPPPLFFIPAVVLLLDVLRKGGSIWSDGVGPIDAFKKGIRARIRLMAGATIPQSDGRQSAFPATPAPLPPDPAAFVPREVLGGPYGDTVQRAATDRAIVRDIVAGLKPIEREMIPEVTPTVDALAERVGALATTLHRLDADVSGASLGMLDQRIAALKTETSTTDRDRRMSLLERQRRSLHDLLERRRTLGNQLESASLALQNLKFDLLKLRSSGIDAAIRDVTSATQEARALSRDIGHVLEAADDLRKL